MRNRFTPACLLLAVVGIAAPAESAEISISVNKTIQRMTVSVDGFERYSWPVSTGTTDYSTPTGAFAPSRLARAHYSREWDNAPMPHSIFFTDTGHAIHGSLATGSLGSPASRGCIRLSPANARILFNLVQAEGPANTRIEITGFDPIGTALGSGNGARIDYSRLTSFDPLTDGILAGSASSRNSAVSEPRRQR